jgi:prepilin-type N-terminal cleavage/methylation domain-containing protein
MQRGFSLFEILLALLVMSMIVVGGIQWSNRKHEEASAQQLGHRLFQYGLAVSEYARQNPAGYTAKNLPPNTFYGIAWLQDPAHPNREMCRDPEDVSTCETFLGEDFNFYFDKIQIAPLIEGNPDSVIHVSFDPPTSNMPGPLTVHSVTVGKVYLLNKTTREYDVDVSLDSRAINFANHFTDQNGSARIFYQLFPLDASGVITGQPFTAGANVDSGYLRTDGSNDMDANIRFSTPQQGLVFQNGDRITQMQNIGADAPVFNRATPNDGNQGNNNQPPIYTWGDFVVFRQQKGVSWISLGQHTVNNSVCFLSGMQKTGNSDDTCRVIPTYSGGRNPSGWALFLDKGSRTEGNPSACYARCFVFNQ